MVKKSEKSLENMQSRIDYLEDVNRWHMFAIDILRQMGDIHGDATTIRNNHAILQAAQTYISMFFKFDCSAFYLISEDDADFYLAEFSPVEGEKDIRLEVEKLIEDGEFSWALNQNKAVCIDMNDGRTTVLHVIASKTRLRGMFVGILEKEHVIQLSEGPLNLLSILLHNTGYAIESAALYQMVHEQNTHLEKKVEERTKELEHTFKHDNLTGLPNRLFFIDRVEQALVRAERTDSMVVVILLDLDMFKVINDTLGHDAGDNLLVDVSARFQETLRRYDTIARIDSAASTTLSRIGGDEFAVLIPDTKTMDNVLTVVHRLVQALADEFEVQDERVFVTSSVGISLYPNDGMDSRSLLKQADLAMYHAKSEGRNNYQFYSDEINQMSSRYLQIGSKLHQALDRDEFKLYYQPQIDLKTHEIIAFEALIRWFPDNGKMVSPAEFIPIAEDTGLIVEIGQWAIEEACRKIAILNKEGFNQIRVAVNLSGKQFRQADLIKPILSAIDQAGIRTEQLELEITEGIIIQDVKKTIEILDDLHSVGMAVAIDDFGTGYSSLSYLKQFKVDCLKVDQSFVRDAALDNDDAAIVRAVVALAHSLDMFVVAEGVETVEQMDFLKSINCEIAQGYYFSRPLPPKDVLPFLLDQKKRV